MSARSSPVSSPESVVDAFHTEISPLDQSLEDAILENDLDAARAALQAGANPNRDDLDPIFSLSSSREMISLLYTHGATVGDVKMTNSARSLLVGLAAPSVYDDTNSETGTTKGPLASISYAQFREGRFRRFGTANPEHMDIPFWRAMVEASCWAYTPRKMFPLREGDDLKDVTPVHPEYNSGIIFPGGPIWCFDRFGHSLTKLPDGTFVQIGGEHEDGYDPDFMIYNDVVVHHPDSTPEAPKYDIYGYPEDVFRPTDFHSATYVPRHNAIYIIGNNGYSGEEDQKIQKRGETPVYRVEVGTWKIEKVVTGGGGPGYVFYHRAQLVGEEISICTDRDNYHDKYSSHSRAKRTVAEGENFSSVEVGLDETWWLSLENLTWRYTTQD